MVKSQKEKMIVQILTTVYIMLLFPHVKCNYSDVTGYSVS